MSTQTVPGRSEQQPPTAVTAADSRPAAGRFAVELVRGDEVRAWLGRSGNLESWDALYATCPWRTPFLSSQFFSAWAKYYDDVLEPLLAIGRNAQGAMVAIMPLARGKGFVTGAGAHQAEYQGWLSDTDLAVRFFFQARTCLSQAFPRDRLFFRYLPPTLPQHILAGISQSDSRVMTHADTRPLLELDQEAIRKTLAKKSNKSKLNRLKRAGELIFKQISSATELERYIDQIIDLYDFRQGAMNDSLPFRDDSRKRPFHLDWMKRAPEQFHVTVMLVDDTVISAHIGIIGSDQTHLAITAHSPFHAQHSPGKLHTYQAAAMLAESGQSYLDLTPGGAWKERFATEHGDVHGLTAWPTAKAARLAAARERAGHAARRLLHRLGVPPAQVKRGLRVLRKATPARLLKHAARLMPEHAELRIYQLTPAQLETDTQGKELAAVDTLADLCAFEPIYDWQSRQAFLLESMQRLEAGNRSYTICANGKLLHVGWLAPRQTASLFSEVNQRFSYPQPGAALYDFFTAPAARRRGYYRRTMRQMLADLKREGSASVAYISVLADNIASRRAIEKTGFLYFCSLYRDRVLWREKHASSLAASDQPDETNT